MTNKPEAIVRKICLLLLLVFNSSFVLLAQDDVVDDRKGKFKKENLFSGAGINLSFGNQTTSLGLIPHFGYSISRFVVVAVSVGYNYISQRDNTGCTINIVQYRLSPHCTICLIPSAFTPESIRDKIYKILAYYINHIGITMNRLAAYRWALDMLVVETPVATPIITFQ